MNLKNKNIIAGLSIILGLGMTSCSKSFIDRNPVDQVSTTTAITTASAMQDALTGVYSLYRSSSFYGRDLVIIGDVQADNSYIASTNSGYYLTPYQYTYINSDSYFTEIWKAGYNIILNLNTIINAAPSGDATTIAEIRSQAYALRALAYSRMVNIYARPYTVDTSAMGIPVVLTDDATSKPARNSVGEVYTQIIKDYTAALDTAAAYSSSVTISDYAIQALLAKAYLYTGQYALALSTAESVISNSGFSLVASTSAAYTAFWANPAVRTDAVEVMFEIDANSIQNNGYDDFAGMYENGYDQIYCDTALYNSYASTDIRKSVLSQNSTTGVVTVEKFPNAASNDRDNIKVVRLAEVYLIAAEAAYHSGNSATALTYLNAIAQNRDPSLTAYTVTGTALLDTIVSQRRKELAFEGDRFYDMNRLQATLYRNAAPPKGLPLASAYATVLYNSYKRIAPIPLVELNANANMVQNTGY